MTSFEEACCQVGLGWSLAGDTQGVKWNRRKAHQGRLHLKLENLPSVSGVSHFTCGMVWM